MKLRPVFPLPYAAAGAHFLFRIGVLAQSALGQAPVPAPKLTFANGQLTIVASDVTLADLLTRVSTLTGVTIDIPPSARTERIRTLEVGPGSARQILAALLSDSEFDYLIQASESDPDKLQNILVLARDKKAPGLGAAPVRSPYARNAPPQLPEEPAPQPSAVNPVTEIAAADPNAAPPPETPSPADAPVVAPSAQPGINTAAASGALRPGALTPPSNLNAESISQQLQQMYQQRVQMTQQERQAGLPPSHP